MAAKIKSNATTPTPSTIEETEETARLAEESKSVSEALLDSNIAMHCVMKNSVSRLVKCFEDDDDPYKAEIQTYIIERNGDGKTPLDMACILGRTAIIKELIARGVDPNTVSEKGYSALHLSAAWGKIECLKLLVEVRCNIQLKTRDNERAREIALRYDHAECVDYMDWAEAKQDFQNCIKIMRDALADPEKVQGRLDRNEKKGTEQLCNEKDQWVEASNEVTTQDFITQKQEFEETCAPIWLKMTEPLPEKEVKKCTL